MGGKNHQPCRSYLVNSTKLSRHLSLARAELEQGNVALEDVLLCELEGETGDADAATRHLRLLLDALEESTKTLNDLRKQMLASRYEELPPLRTLDLASVGDALASMGLVSTPSWDRIVAIRLRDGFYGVLDHFEGLLQGIKEMTTTLDQQFSTASERGNLTCVLEENLPGNFKAAFARLYTAYLDFESDFLASSVLSTEIWYSFTGRGSLTQNQPLRKSA